MACLSRSSAQYFAISAHQSYWTPGEILKTIFYLCLSLAVMLICGYLIIHIKYDPTVIVHHTLSSTPKPRLQCFHCITNKFGNLTQPEISSETQCQDKPLNIRICEEGEFCWRSSYGVDGTFMRTCMKKGMFAMGCHNITKPHYAYSCLCDTNLCM